MANDGGSEFNVGKQVKKRLRRRLALFAILAMVLGGLLFWLLYFSSYLTLRTITVAGSEIAGQDAVIDATGLHTGLPMARIPTREVERKVTDSLPSVSSVEVKRHWPDTLAITVTERVPLYQVTTGELYAWVDASGVVFHHTQEAQPVPVATITDATVELLASTATILSALPEDLSALVARITVDSLDSTTLVLSDGRTIMWGSSENCDLKVQVATALLATGAHSIDISAPEYPVVR